jgi:trehalose synthase
VRRLGSLVDTPNACSICDLGHTTGKRTSTLRKVSADLQPMAVARGSLAAYAPVAGPEAVERLRAAAEPLQGARVLHVTAARAGGRVPELLSATLPLARDAGLEPEWRVLFGPELEPVTRALQEGMQGAETAVGDSAWGAYLEECAGAARSLADGVDLVVLHDPGVLGLAAELEGPVVWHCHVDAADADPPILERAAPLLERCGQLAFPDVSFAPDPQRERARAAPPGIDPLNPRNLDPAPRLAGRVVRPLGVDLNHPFVCQVMRMDRWKDPHATLEALGIARREIPELRLVIAAALDASDPDEWRAVKEVADYGAGRDGVHLLTSYEGVGNLELGALQRLARASLQLSIREGFGLAASEALWKGTPVVGGRQGGLPLQLRDGVDGYLTDSVEEAAARVVELVRDPGLAIEMGRAGQQRVRERFLVTRALEDELRVLGSALTGR